MNADRFDHLLQQLLDGELVVADAEELAGAVRQDPGRLSELRQHLVLWELWSQQLAPERSAAAFLAACRTRVVADRQTDQFVAEVTRRIEHNGHSTVARLWAAVRGWLAPLRTPPTLAWTAVSTLLVAFGAWFIGVHPVRASTVHGEAVCVLCFLHEGHEHVPAIRVHNRGGTEIYYVESDPRAVQELGNYCAAPVPLVATGPTELRAGRHLIDIQSLQRGAPLPSTPGQPDQRTLFPF